MRYAALRFRPARSIGGRDANTWSRRAGLDRNLRMLDSKPDLVLAFWDGQSRGTEHTITEARRRNIPVVVMTERTVRP